MIFKWDRYSDQPHVIKDRALKKSIYSQVRWDSFKLLLTNIVMYPLCIINYFLLPEKKVGPELHHFFGVSINQDKNPKETTQLIDELGVNNLLIRMPLSDIENINLYVDFAEQYKEKNLLINILQDRRHVEDEALLLRSLDQVFTKFSPFSDRFQIGNAINRKKWAFFSMDEFLQFYRVAYELRNSKFPHLNLLGSSVIDFEYYFSIRTLFNLYKVRFDQFSSLLYVDRRGAPENTQMGLNLMKKLHLMQAMLRLSWKSSNEIVITETNWPITNTAPYAPTSEDDCVSLEEQANYLVRYYLLALASGVVKNVYWHQLIAPGYGLVDNRSDKLIKYPSYTAFKVMLAQLQEAEYQNLEIKGEIHCVSFIKKSQTIDVYWSANSVVIESENNGLTLDVSKQHVIDRDGNKVTSDSIVIGESPIYIITDNTL